MKKQIINILAILAILLGSLFILTGCGDEDKTDISELNFDPKGVWVDTSDGELMFKLYANGSMEYRADDVNSWKPGTWKVVGKNIINFSLGEDGDYNLDLIQSEGYNLIGNENSTFCS